jgi:hypothetical protein
MQQSNVMSIGSGLLKLRWGLSNEAVGVHEAYRWRSCRLAGRDTRTAKDAARRQRERSTEIGGILAGLEQRMAELGYLRTCLRTA